MTAVVTRQQQPRRIAVTVSSLWSLTDRDVSSRMIRRCVLIGRCLLLNPAEMKRRASSPEGWRRSQPPPCNACSHHQLQWEERHVCPPVDWPGAGDLRFHIRKTWEDWRGRCWEWKQCRRGFSFKWVLVNLIKRLTLLLHHISALISAVSLVKMSTGCAHVINLGRPDECFPNRFD